MSETSLWIIFQMNFLSSTFRVIVNHSCKVLYPKLGLKVVFGRDVDFAFGVKLIQFLEHGGVCALKNEPPAHKKKD